MAVKSNNKIAIIWGGMFLIFCMLYVVGRLMFNSAAQNPDIKSEAVDTTPQQQAFSIELAGFVPIEIGMNSDAAELAIRNHFLAGAQEGSLPLFNSKTLADSVQFSATRENLPDDSVSAQQLLAIFEGDRLVNYGMRIKCYRGNNIENWQIELCP